MKTHYELSDLQFEHSFANCTLDPTLFTHEAHLRLAWIHITKYGVNTAIANITHQLQNFVGYAGAADKYNQTVTVAAIKAVNHFVAKKKINDFLDFITEYPRLKTAFRELMWQHYTTDIFKSEEAKRVFLEPELLSFDPQV